VNAHTRKALRAAEQAAARLVEECRMGGPLYAQSPKAVAQVSRTGKWFLNALAALGGDPNAPAAPESQPKS
jgi:hypothetical protein